MLINDKGGLTHMIERNKLFPEEHIIELKGISPFLVGRIVITQGDKGYDAEIDIIQTESGKIYNHVEIIYGEIDSREAFNLGLYKLKQFLLQKIN